jgi:hypothetical protein
VTAEADNGILGNFAGVFAEIFLFGRPGEFHSPKE